MDRITRLTPSALEVVLREFAPGGVAPGADVNGKFINFASKVNARGQQEAGQQPKPRRPGPANLGHAIKINLASPANHGWSGGWSPAEAPAVLAAAAEQMQVMGMPSVDDIQNFIDKWGLNEDSIQKIQKLSPAALKVVIQEFAPHGESHDWNGKFILFASQVEKGIMGGTSPSIRKMGYQNELQAFAMRWNLNADAQAKLNQLNPTELQIVLTDFKAPQTATQVDGMFIKFAGSVQKRLRQGG